MKKILLIVGLLLWCGSAYGQSVTLPAYQSSTGAIVDSVSNPLPVAVYGGTSGFCLTSNGASSAATFQACGSGGGVSSINTVNGGFTFTGSGVSCVGTTCTFSGGGGSGTVTSVSVVTANGVSGSVATATTTPAITLTLGAITPTTVNGLTISTSTGTLTITNAKTLAVTNSLTLSGTDGSNLNVGTGGTLGTAAYVNTGTSGGTVPLLNGNWTESGTPTFSAGVTMTGLSSGTVATNSYIGLNASNQLVLGSGGGGGGAVTLGTSASATNPQRSGQAGTGLYSDTTNVVDIGANSNPVVTFTNPASAVDYLTITGSATANPATASIAAAGSDSNINIALTPLGAGAVNIGTSVQGANILNVNGPAIFNNSSNGALANLEIKTTNANGYAYVGLYDNAGTQQGQFVVGGTSTGADYFTIQQFGNLPIAFTTNGSERMRVLGGGGLAIGTTTASGGSLLTVNGTVSDSTSTLVDAAGTGLSKSSQTLNSNAVYQVSFQTGIITTITSTISVYSKVSKTSTVDNMIASAAALSCLTNPTVTLYECGSSTTCSSPITIASVQVTASGTATPATVSSPSITAGDYIGWAISAGNCTSLNLSANAQVHSN